VLYIFLSLAVIVIAAAALWTVYSLFYLQIFKVQHDDTIDSTVQLPPYFLHIILMFIYALMFRHIFLRMEAMKTLDEHSSLFALRSVRLVNKEDFAAEEQAFQQTEAEAEKIPLVENNTMDSRSSTYIDYASISATNSTKPSYNASIREARNPRSSAILLEPPMWKDSKTCKGCDMEFGMTTTRHHCRHCGETFCEDCSKNKTPINKFGWTQPVRVCDKCYIQLVSY